MEYQEESKKHESEFSSDHAFKDLQQEVYHESNIVGMMMLAGLPFRSFAAIEIPG